MLTPKTCRFAVNWELWRTDVAETNSHLLTNLCYWLVEKIANEKRQFAVETRNWHWRVAEIDSSTFSQPSCLTVQSKQEPWVHKYENGSLKKNQIGERCHRKGGENCCQHIRLPKKARGEKIWVLAWSSRKGGNVSQKRGKDGEADSEKKTMNKKPWLDKCFMTRKVPGHQKKR